jgi:hypothetical protein
LPVFETAENNPAFWMILITKTSLFLIKMKHISGILSGGLHHFFAGDLFDFGDGLGYIFQINRVVALASVRNGCQVGAVRF